MLAQYLVSLRATNSRKSMRSNKAVNSLQASKERTFRANMLVESLYILGQRFSPSLFVSFS